MATMDMGAAAPLIGELQACHLLAPEHLGRIRGHLQAATQREPADLVEFLVRQGILTPMQGDWVRDERTRDLLLAQFVLTEEIGAGSMGTVYKARSLKGDAWYAVKIVPRRNVVSLAAIAEKVHALREIRHPRVSALVHLGASEERVYLAWPWLDGGEKLDAFVRRQGKLATRQTIQIGLQVASGLQPYHEQGLFHGLLKPSDIVIGGDRRARILDFGVGFLLTSERGKSLLDTMTNSRALARGLDCSSPESISNPLDRTPAGDQYSLGCILYFCLTGQFPFPHEHPVKKMLAHQCEEPTPLRELNPQASPRLTAIVARMMAKIPEERHESIADVVRELQSLTQTSPRRAAGQPALSPVPAKVRTDEQDRPWRVSAWVPIGVAAGIAAGIVLGVLLAQR